MMEMQTPVLENFDQWKEFLSKQISNAKSAGASDESIVNAATRIGNFLADKVDPRNREQRLLKELWDRGTEDERHALMSMTTKMLSDGKVH
ncbi:MAG: hypothetical protein K0R39_2490 [Symbiobacteriaceae bacterium]|jgi:hypothetical protein|nr:hypothetical protein [Symbiobacteriaceae bacterium]